MTSGTHQDRSRAWVAVAESLVRSGWRRPDCRLGRLVRASLAVARFVDPGKGVFAVARYVNCHSHEQGEETQIQGPLEYIVRTQMVEGRGVAAQTGDDRGQTSVPRSADV